MKKLLFVIAVLASSVAYANCVTNTTVTRDGMIVCTTCCNNGNCTTTCI